MTVHQPIDSKRFSSILRRNVVLPLGVGLLSVGVFIALLLYLLDAMNWVEHTERVIAGGNELAKLTSQREGGLQRYLLSGEDRFLEPYTLSSSTLATQAAALKKLVADNPAQVERINKIIALQESWTGVAESLIALRASHSDARDLPKLERGRQISETTQRELLTFLDTEYRLRKERSDAAHALTTVTITAFPICMLVLTGALAWFGRRELSSLSGSYEAALAQQAEQARALTEQAWKRDRQIELASEVVGRYTHAELSNTVLAFLSRHVDVVVGALYVLDDGDKLTVAGTYGLAHDAPWKSNGFTRGEGIPGRAILEGQTLKLAPLPDHYLRVTSALGRGQPAEILAIPTQTEGKRNGVLELGFMTPVDQRVQTFLEEIATSVGGFIKGGQYRERLQQALEQAQRLNEELQVQQEELRVSNEELEERTQALMESQSRLEIQQTELEQANARLEHHTERLESQRQDLVEAHRRLEENARTLERASQYKSQFLANMSHELRTPLNSALILAKLLQDNREGNLSEDEIRYASTIHAANTDLLNLINDILDLAKIEAGQVTLVPEPVELSALTEEVHRIFAPVAEHRKLAFSIETAPDVPSVIETDGSRLQQVLRNLLSNAFKFTEQGSVVLRVAPVGPGKIAFEVCDTGIGIAPEKQDLIFEAFQQADATTNRRFGGTGLGLSISRELAHLLQGQLSVQSETGRGTTFTLQIPVRYERVNSELAALSQVADDTNVPVAPRTAAQAPSRAVATEHARTIEPLEDDRNGRTRGKRLILVVEDDLSFARILYDLAHELDFDCIHATSAQQGLALAREHQPCGILLDVALPDHSGLTLLDWLKHDAVTRHIPAHMVSVADHSEAALHLGAVGYTLKPSARDALAQAITMLETRVSAAPQRVLVVEDDERLRQSIRDLLAPLGAEITTVNGVQSALGALEATHYDCVVMDLLLSDGTGHELLEQMASADHYPMPPVIVYTGRQLSPVDEQRLRRYSKSIIVKGARSPERLLDEVTLFLHSVDAALPATHQRMLRSVWQRDNVMDGRTILLAEDDARNIFALTKILEPLGATVEIARNGREAVQRFQQLGNIDLVLMDIMMPEMDGLEAMQQLRALSNGAQIPIIALTAKAMSSDREACLQAGANDYVAKPIDVDRLLSLCRVWLSRR
ncbi:response regulator [Ralstonia pickettii]|uniref:response regulator n=1 Tax=Ralstonia pickettii TaxID=329 RepID=UPI002714A2DF|nr:response regulator [Ralstonia pickettii]WKZ86467.1 response regulator [Ralstonia pickettii]